MKINPQEHSTPPLPGISPPEPPPDLAGEDYRVWKQELERAGLASRPSAVLTEYLRAVRELRGVDLLEAVEFYRRHYGQIRWITVENLVEIYLAEMHGLPRGQARPLRAHLEQFARAFPGPLTAVIATDVQIWFDILAEQLGPRALQAYRGSVSALYIWARRHRYWRAADPLPTDVLELEDDYLKSADGLLAPSDFQTLLIAAHRDPAVIQEILPLLVLGGLAGLRAPEIRRFTWESADRSNGRLLIQGRSLPTGGAPSRELKLSQVSATWLQHLEARLSTASPGDNLNAPWTLARLARRLEIHWPRNALRNSWIAYRQALLLDETQTGLEADLPAATVLKHFAGRASRADAEAWFGILPEWCVME